MCGKDDPNKLVCFEKFQVRPESNLFIAQPVLCVLPGSSMTEAFITIRIIEVKLYFLTVNLNKKRRVKD